MHLDADRQAGPEEAGQVVADVVDLGGSDRPEPGRQQSPLGRLRVVGEQVDVLVRPEGRVGIAQRDLGSLHDHELPVVGRACPRQQRGHG
jgi:hypothetical protein